ncbi:MAG: ABC transporter ATP-binding protein [Oscillospiraceae bacterium]
MILELNHIYKTYLQGKLDVPVLKDISMGVDKGEYVAIMGPSGSGKTTLMNIIGCLDKATEGTYLLAGNDIQKKNDSQLSDVRLSTIGFVFQSFHLMPRETAAENVALPLVYAGVKLKERKEWANEALRKVGLADRVDFKPTQLSGGQCQRVAIARAIVNHPDILLADEPTGALDSASGEQIMELFQALNDDGVTIVMITHEQEIANHAKRVLHIRDGQFVEHETYPPGHIKNSVQKEAEAVE